MCGILGFINYESDIIDAQIGKLRHRGPDAFNVWRSNCEQVQLGHTRLSIIDLSDQSSQPMQSACGRFVIVFNGEIYNFREVRGKLEKLGLTFQTTGDTEVVLQAYMAWGADCLAHFNGMFAFAIYRQESADSPGEVFFARDRVGKKPFYYIHAGARFQFASEVKALTIREPLDVRALNSYLSLGYVPGDQCLYAGVKKLPPGHAGRLNVATGQLEIWRYWSLPKQDPYEDQTEEEVAEEVLELLYDSVRLRMIADVPLGVFLSGGLDSSLVTAAAAHVAAKPPQTFTIRVPHANYDESVHAQVIADHFQTEHHVLEADLASFAPFNELSPFIDEPIADSSIIPTFLVSRLTRRHVTVALGGDGGDELFGGYTHYMRTLRDSERLAAMPLPILHAAARLAANLPAGIRGRNWLASLRGGAAHSMVWGTPYFDPELRRRIFCSEAVSALGADLEAPEMEQLGMFSAGVDLVDSMTRLDFQMVLPDDFLVKVDRASMANSLEVRAPFLDYRLVEHAFRRIPSRMKISGGMTRRVQRILAKRILPVTVNINRKQGFSVPMDEWFRTDRCHTLIERLDCLPEFISQAEVGRLIQGQMQGRTNGSRLFALLMLATACGNHR